MGRTWVTIATTALLVSTIALVGPLVGDAGARRAPAAVAGMPLVARAPEVGLIAIAGPVRGRIRVLYARNGAMVWLREISVPDAAQIRELSLSADGRDLFVATDASAYAMSTRTGRVEAQALAASEGRYVARMGRAGG